MTSIIPLYSLARLAWSLETGLRAGRPWIGILQWLSEREQDRYLKKYLPILLHKVSSGRTEEVLREEQERGSGDLLWVLFFEILLQAPRGPQKMAGLLKIFSKTADSLSKLKKQEQSLLFVPKFQTWIAISIAVIFPFVLPAVSGGLFPSFLTLGRYDLFCTGIAVLVFGFLIMHFLCRRPQRLLKPMLSISFFFQFMSVYLDVGFDFATAWMKASSAVQLPSHLQRQILRSGLNVESTEEFLEKLSHTLPAPWPSLLTGILWARTSGLGLSEYLQEVSEKETQRLLFQWKDEVRKLTMLTLLPLSIFIMVPTLFLLVGPQILTVMK